MTIHTNNYKVQYLRLTEKCQISIYKRNPLIFKSNAISKLSHKDIIRFCNHLKNKSLLENYYKANDQFRDLTMMNLNRHTNGFIINAISLLWSIKHNYVNKDIKIIQKVSNFLYKNKYIKLVELYDNFSKTYADKIDIEYILNQYNGNNIYLIELINQFLNFARTKEELFLITLSPKEFISVKHLEKRKEINKIKTIQESIITQFTCEKESIFGTFEINHIKTKDYNNFNCIPHFHFIGTKNSVNIFKNIANDHNYNVHVKQFYKNRDNKINLLNTLIYITKERINHKKESVQFKLLNSLDIISLYPNKYRNPSN